MVETYGHLDSAYLQKRIIETQPTSVQNQSALTAAGASTVDYGTDVLRRIAVGGANIVEEGEAKPLNNVAVDEQDVNKVKLVYMIKATDEFLDNEQGRREANEFVAQAASGLVESADIAILAGTNPATGEAYGRLADVNLKNNAVQYVQGEDEEIWQAIHGGMTSGRNRKTVLLSDNGFAGISMALDPNGYERFPRADQNSAFPMWSATANRFTSVGLDGFLGFQEIENDVLAYTGNFAGISRAFSPVTITASKEATVAGESAFEHNLTFYRVEQTVRWFVSDLSSFTAIRSGE